MILNYNENNVVVSKASLVKAKSINRRMGYTTLIFVWTFTPSNERDSVRNWVGKAFLETEPTMTSPFSKERQLIRVPRMTAS